MTVIANSLLQRTMAFGTDAVHEVQHVIDPLVHAVRQPVSGIVTDAHEVTHALWSSSGPIMRLGVYWVGGWLVWTAFGDVFPQEKRALTSTVSRAWKRARLN